MKKNPIALTGFLILTIFFGINAVKAEVAVIVHKENTATFTDKQIKQIFNMKTNLFPDGKKAKIIIPIKNPKLIEKFARKVCKKRGHQLQSTWKKMLFTGQGVIHRVRNDSEVIQKVSSDYNYIGIIDAQNTTGSVKTVKTF